MNITNLSTTGLSVKVETDIFEYNIDIQKVDNVIKSITGKTIYKKATETEPKVFIGTCYKDEFNYVTTILVSISANDRKAFIDDFENVITVLSQ